MHRFPHWLIAALFLLPLLSHPAAYAQNEPAGAGIPDQKLDATAAAMVHVSDIQKTYRQKLESTAPQDQNRVAEEADTALEKAVTDQGLSVDEYTTILKTAQNDPSIREKL